MGEAARIAAAVSRRVVRFMEGAGKGEEVRSLAPNGNRPLEAHPVSLVSPILDQDTAHSMILTYVYRVLPTKRQHRALEAILESQRHLYNAALQERIEAY